MNSKEKTLRQELKRLREKLKESLAKRGDAFVHGGDGWHDNFSFENLEMEYHYLSSRLEAVRRELKELLAQPPPPSRHPDPPVGGEGSSVPHLAGLDSSPATGAGSE